MSMRAITPAHKGQPRKCGTRCRIGKITLIAPARFAIATDDHWGRALVAMGTDRAQAARILSRMKYSERWKLLNARAESQRNGISTMVYTVDVTGSWKVAK